MPSRRERRSGWLLRNPDVTMTGFSVGSGGSGGLSAMLAKAVDSNTGRHHQVFRIDIPASFQDETHILDRPHSRVCKPMAHPRSEEHTSELQSLMRISYAVFCLQKKKNN